MREQKFKNAYFAITKKTLGELRLHLQFFSCFYKNLGFKVLVGIKCEKKTQFLNEKIKLCCNKMVILLLNPNNVLNIY